MKNYEINVDKLIQEKYINYLCYKLSFIYKNIQKTQTTKQLKLNQKSLKRYQTKLYLCKEHYLIHKDFLKICS